MSSNGRKRPTAAAAGKPRKIRKPRKPSEDEEDSNDSTHSEPAPEQRTLSPIADEPATPLPEVWNLASLKLFTTRRFR